MREQINTVDVDMPTGALLAWLRAFFAACIAPPTPVARIEQAIADNPRVSHEVSSSIRGHGLIVVLWIPEADPSPWACSMRGLLTGDTARMRAASRRPERPDWRDRYPKGSRVSVRTLHNGWRAGEVGDRHGDRELHVNWGQGWNEAFAEHEVRPL